MLAALGLHCCVWASVIATCWLSSCGTQASLPCSEWDLPKPGIKPLAPALAGGSEPLHRRGSPPTDTLWALRGAQQRASCGLLGERRSGGPYALCPGEEPEARHASALLRLAVSKQT